MADQEEEHLQMAISMSLRPPFPPRGQAGQAAGGRRRVPGGSGEAAAGERRIAVSRAAAAAAVEVSKSAPPPLPDGGVTGASAAAPVDSPGDVVHMDRQQVAGVAVPACTGTKACCRSGTRIDGGSETRKVKTEVELSSETANQLFFMLFGSSVSGDILLQWTNQGIRKGQQLQHFEFLPITPRMNLLMAQGMRNPFKQTSSIGYSSIWAYASQEIVNLLICGEAVPNVFDGRMELGDSMFLKGIPGSVKVGFLVRIPQFLQSRLVPQMPKVAHMGCRK